MGQLVGRINTALTTGSWTDECGNVWTVNGTLHSDTDPNGENNAIDFYTYNTSGTDLIYLEPSKRSSIFNIQDEWTVTMWAKKSSEDFGFAFSFGKSVKNNDTEFPFESWDGDITSYGLEIAGNSIIIYYGYNDTAPVIADIGAVANSPYKWFLIELNKDKNNNVRIFVNGKLITNTVFSSNFIPRNDGLILVGNWLYKGRYLINKFKGSLYDLSIYDYVLHYSNYAVDTFSKSNYVYLY